MSDLIDRYAQFEDQELLDAQKALAQAVLSGATQVTFLGQTVIYNSDMLRRRALDEITDVCKARKLIPDSSSSSSKGKRTKRLRITTTNSGF